MKNTKCMICIFVVFISFSICMAADLTSEEQAIVDSGTIKAKELNFNPLPFIDRNGKYAVPAGFSFYLDKGQIVIRDKDLLINATGNTLKTEGGPLPHGRFGYLKDGKMNILD